MKTQKYFQKTPLILSAALFVFFSFTFIFLYKEINDSNTEIQTKEGEWHVEAMRRSEVKTLNTSIQKIENERAELETHFAKSSDVVPFLDTMEALGPQAGARMEITTVDISADGSGLLVGMRVSGSFDSVYKFLILLENSPYELEFLSMDLQKRAGEVGEAGNPVWDATFRIKLLSFML